MTLENCIREGVELLRARGHTVTEVTEDAVAGEAVNGTVPDNPDTDAGSESGRELLTVDGRVFYERQFAGCASGQAVAQTVEALLG